MTDQERAEAKVLTTAESTGAASEAFDSHAQLTYRLARGALIYVFSLVAGKGLTVVLQVILGRWLGPAAYGLYSLGFSVITVVLWLARLGLDQGVLRYCAVYRAQSQPAKVRATLWRAIAVAMIGSVLLTVMIVANSDKIAARLFAPSFASVLALFALSMPFFAFAKIAATYLQSANEIYRMSVLQNLAQPVANLALLTGAIVLGFGLEGAVGAFVLATSGTAVLGIYYLSKTLPRPAEAAVVARTVHTPMMQYSLALMFAGLSYQIILRAPILLLGHLSSKAEVGVFSAGASFALSFGFVTVTFLQPAMPMMVELYEAKHFDGLRRLYVNASRWTLAAVVPFFLFLCLFRAEVMRLFGHKFSEGGTVLLILSLGWLIYYGKGPASAILEMTGRQNLELANMAGAAALTVATNYLAIPRYGTIGAAVATAGSIAVWALVEYLEARLIYGLSPWSPGAIRNLLVALITAAATVLLRPLLSSSVLFLVTAIFYGTLYFGLSLEAGDGLVATTVLSQALPWLRRPPANDQ
jgi:O-antigen/teichoic acid export membrane protein